MRFHARLGTDAQHVPIRPDTVPSPRAGSDQRRDGVTHSVHSTYYYGYDKDI